MPRRIEYPLSLFFEQLHWAWLNLNYRPDQEEHLWQNLVNHFQGEIAKHWQMKKAVIGRPLK